MSSGEAEATDSARRKQSHAMDRIGVGEEPRRRPRLASPMLLRLRRWERVEAIGHAAVAKCPRLNLQSTHTEDLPKQGFFPGSATARDFKTS